MEARHFDGKVLLNEVRDGNSTADERRVPFFQLVDTKSNISDRRKWREDQSQDCQDPEL